ncbi:hypothetical protein [Blautia wexlerae]|jgi:hypothetical protein|uniref:hypothetical protein n=1 Tax=Blautia wexlerae TaxID=418240 RepID=UPI00321A180C
MDSRRKILENNGQIVKFKREKTFSKIFKNIQKYWNILMGLLPCISRGVILDERCKRTEAE